MATPHRSDRQDQGVTTNGGEAGLTQFFRVPVMETPAGADL
jgi:hypothetical protein